jgi:hypothetical protein
LSQTRRIHQADRGSREFRVKSQSPSREQTVAARVFHSNRYAIETAVFDFNHRSKDEAPAPLVFHFNNDPFEEALAAGVFHGGRRDFAPMLFHSCDLIPRQARAS